MSRRPAPAMVALQSLRRGGTLVLSEFLVVAVVVLVAWLGAVAALAVL